MMITTDFAPGSPCWLDLGAPDVAAAATFYGSVFGWQLRSFGPEASGYGFFQLDGRTVGAVGPLEEEEAGSAWTIYFSTHDAEATAHTVERSDGTIRDAPLDVGGEGRMAQLTDPLGARFAVWQPDRTKGLDVVDEPGALNWIELYTTDASAAKEFYGDLLGWETEDMSMPGGEGTYTLIIPGGGGQERAQGGIVQLPAEYLNSASGSPYWHPVFRVADCDAALTRATDSGGSVRMGPEDAEGVGRLAVCLDPSGAEFVVLTPAGS